MHYAASSHLFTPVQCLNAVFLAHCIYTGLLIVEEILGLGHRCPVASPAHPPPCAPLHCTALYCTALHFTALHCIVLHAISSTTRCRSVSTHLHSALCTLHSALCTGNNLALHCTALHCTVLHCTALYVRLRFRYSITGSTYSPRRLHRYTAGGRPGETTQTYFSSDTHSSNWKVSWDQGYTTRDLFQC